MSGSTTAPALGEARGGQSLGGVTSAQFSALIQQANGLFNPAASLIGGGGTAAAASAAPGGETGNPPLLSNVTAAVLGLAGLCSSAGGLSSPAMTDADYASMSGRLA